ncbi:hypothetical protein [Nostoc sp. FACHB-110]|uniref:hypothetical protein n=1 Tax=Nostoc sp. FACHB-110 TaxID=2692834 RepID=UPI0016836D37|nr:hypothetical protein [Nostoc sp. FACHB-110]MBD2441181.1 hypothetical protein [Nostoc sp. FACHB-110]
MKNCDRPVQFGVRVRLSGVVTVPEGHSPNCSASENWKEILISSFVETRFKNVLGRSTVLQRVDWFWHQENSMHLCEEAVALVAHNANDYRQILIKQNHLSSTLPDLDPVAQVLLLVSPLSDYVFGTVLETGEMFSTHILFVQQEEYNRGATVQNCLGQNLQTNCSIAKPNSDATPPSSLSLALIGGGI